jgi:hypothetical protein
MDSPTGFFDLVDTLRSAGPELDAHSKIESIEVAVGGQSASVRVS